MFVTHKRTDLQYTRHHKDRNDGSLRATAEAPTVAAALRCGIANAATAIAAAALHRRSPAAIPSSAAAAVLSAATVSFAAAAVGFYPAERTVGLSTHLFLQRRPPQLLLPLGLARRFRGSGWGRRGR